MASRKAIGFGRFEFRSKQRVAIPANWKHALAMLPHLAECAKQGKTITYKELGDLIGHPAFYLGGPLDVLRDEILVRHNLPRLDALVVNQDTAEVGEMFYKGGRGELDDETFGDLLSHERKRVFEFQNWDKVIANIISHYTV